MTLPDRMARKGRLRETVKLGVSRSKPKGGDERLVVELLPRDVPWVDRKIIVYSAGAETSPLPIPALGIAIKVLSVIHEVDSDGPAARARVLQGDKPASSGSLAAGDEIVKLQFVPADEKQFEDEQYRFALKEIVLIDKDSQKASWPYVAERLQLLPPGAKVKLTLRDERTALVALEESSEQFDPDRGFNFTAATVLVKADNFGQALALGAEKTRRSALIVYRFLGALLRGQVSAKSLGGIGTIGVGAAAHAREGLTYYLMFLIAISANLAVINMLPIPVLDGGHMVFLIWEAIRGKPPSEAVQVRLTWVGAFLILGLLVWSNGLDVVRLIDWLREG
jgi:regulator of sigma E protease